MEKILDYNISVTGKIVTLTIEHQSPKVKKFFSYELIKFGKFEISDLHHLDLRSDKLFLMGVSTTKTETFLAGTTSHAFRYAADLADALEQMCAAIEKECCHTIKYASGFVIGNTYLNTKTGNIYIITHKNGTTYGTFNLNTNVLVAVRFAKSQYIEIPDSWVAVVSTFGTNRSSTAILKKFEELNSSTSKMFWHK